MATAHKLDEEQMKMAEELLFQEALPMSFAKSMFFGRFDPSKALPYSKLKDEEVSRFNEFMNRLRMYLDENLNPAEIDKNAEIPREVIKGLGDVGLLGMTVPVEYGGQGFSQHAYCKAIEEVGSRCGATAVFVNAHHSIGLRTLLIFGTEEQKKTWLPSLCSGEKICAFALTEPNAGSDVSNIETVAEYDPETDTYVINGKKQWITNGGMSDVLTVMAQTEVETKNGKAMKVSAFLVTNDMEGFVVTEKALEKVGIRGTWTAKLEFHNMRVPAANIVGKKGAGLSIPLGILNFGRITFGASCTGAAKFCMEHAISHASKRVQFKRPIGSFGLIKEKLSMISAMSYAMDAGTYLTASMFDRGVKDYMLEAAMIKVFASEALWEIINETIQVYGGKAFFTDHPFERMMRDARLNSIGEGANEVLHNFIGLVGMREVGLSLQRLEEKAHHLTEIGSFLTGSIGTLWSMFKSPEIPLKVNELSEELDELKSLYRKFHWAVTKLLARYKEEVVEAQLDVKRISDMAIALYTSTAVIIKWENDAHDQNSDKDQLKVDLQRAKYYLHMAFDKFEKSIASIKSNRDDETCSLSDMLTGLE
ncbi:MAG: acyl-CoA dehydrogenase family protein [Lentisphaeraceae bacterium]|nr:acyl-CoA dehydrogenase family protein [Lentisphaeraceae bacterium]